MNTIVENAIQALNNSGLMDVAVVVVLIISYIVMWLIIILMLKLEEYGSYNIIEEELVMTHKPYRELEADNAALIKGIQMSRQLLEEQDACLVELKATIVDKDKDIADYERLVRDGFRGPAYYEELLRYLNGKLETAEAIAEIEGVRRKDAEKRLQEATQSQLDCYLI